MTINANAKYVLAGAEYLEPGVGTITGSTAAANMPVTYLQTSFPWQKWRSSGLSSVYMHVDLGVARAVYGIWLGYSNFRPGVTQWRPYAADTEAGLTSSPPYSPGISYALAASGYDSTTYATDWPEGTHAFLHSGGITYTQLFNRRWLRIELTDAAHPDNYFQAGRLLILGAGWAPLSYYAWGSQPNAEKLTADWQRARGGTLYPNETTESEDADFQFNHLTTAEARTLRKLMRNRGSQREVLSIDLDGSSACEQTLLHGFVSAFDQPKKAGWVSGAVDYRSGFSVESATAFKP